MHNLLKKSYLVVFCFLFAGCSSLPFFKSPPWKNEKNLFQISLDNILYVHAKPRELEPVISDLSGSLSFLFSQRVSEFYWDYSKSNTHARLLGNFTKNWLKASLWNHPKMFENYSTLKEGKFKIKGTPYFLSIPNHYTIHLSKNDFFSDIFPQKSPSKIPYFSYRNSENTLEESAPFPFYFHMNSVFDFLSKQEIILPDFFKLPFHSIKGHLTLQKDKSSLITLSFQNKPEDKNPPSIIAVRLAISFLLSNFSSNPLTKAWKSAHITINNYNPYKETIARFTISNKDLNVSLKKILEDISKKSIKNP